MWECSSFVWDPQKRESNPCEHPAARFFLESGKRTPKGYCELHSESRQMQPYCWKEVSLEEYVVFEVMES